MASSDNPWRACRPDAQVFDEVRIVTTPRYKESELSGDEWRISATVQFWRKGHLITTHSLRNIETACGFAYSLYHKIVDDGKGFFAEDRRVLVEDRRVCDQEGCALPATKVYTLKKGYHSDGSDRPLHRTGEFRCFCDQHKTRGDCGLEDADNNYVETTFEAVGL